MPRELLQFEVEFIECARKGELLKSGSMSIYMIALLRHPSNSSERHNWHNKLLKAMNDKKLPAPNNSTDHVIHCSTGTYLTIRGYHLRKSDYREYALLQQLLGNPIPGDSLEHCWIPDLIPKSDSTNEVSTVCLSDSAFGAQQREQRQRLAQSNQAARQLEWGKWRAEGQRIQSLSERKMSKSELANKIKKSLKLPDSENTIRQKI
jgi:hypothetical protein